MRSTESSCDGLHKLAAIILIAALLTAGCHRSPFDASSERAAGPDEPIHALAYMWRGDSPGAEFHYTHLQAAEIDLVEHRIRTVHREAHYPEPMIAAPTGAPPELPDEEWSPIDADLEQALRTAAADWLAGRPPNYCVAHRSTGRESGFLVRFSLTTKRGVWRVEVNPEPPAQPTQDCAWPDYRRLIDLLLPPSGREFQRAR